MDESSQVMQAGSEAPAQDAAPSSEGQEQAGETSPQPVNWRERAASDAELQQFIREESNRLFQKERDRQRKADLKRLAQEARTAVDEETRNERAAKVAQLVADEEDPEEAASKEFVAKARVAEQSIARLRRTAEYAEVWEKHGQAEMNRRWQADPEEFADWMGEQVDEARVTKRARQLARDLSKAEAEDITNQRLRNVAAPISGSSGTGGSGMNLDRLLSLSYAERTKWKRENPSSYDALVAEAAAQ